MTTEQPPQAGAGPTVAGSTPEKAADPGSDGAVESPSPAAPGAAPLSDAESTAGPRSGDGAPKSGPSPAAASAEGGRPPKPVRRWGGLWRGRAKQTDATRPDALQATVPAHPGTPAESPLDPKSTKDPVIAPVKPVSGPEGASEPVGRPGSTVEPSTEFPTNGSPAEAIPAAASKGSGKEPTPDSASKAGDPESGLKTGAAGKAGDGGEGASVLTGAEPEAETSAKGLRRRKPRLPSTRPPGAPPDPWTAFAETSERSPGRIRRVARAAGRALTHEYALVIYGSLLLAVLLTWPTLRYPLHTFPQDIWDPSRQAWQVSWIGHILITDPAQLWQANAFFPEAYSYAFGDSLLGYVPAGLLGSGPLAAVLRYNILFVLAHALLAIGGYALIRQLGAGRTGAMVGAVAAAYAPWRLAQEGHLDIVSAGGIPLALAMLARGHGWSMRYGFRPGRRHAGWATAGWLVAIWQLSLGFSLGLPFAYVLGALFVIVAFAVLVRRLRRRSPRPVLGWRLLVTDLLGLLIFAAVGVLIALPYLRVPDTGPAGTEIKFFSAPLRGLLIGPAESRIWGSPHAVPRQSLGWPAEMALLPGFVLYALALVGLVFSVWRIWHRLLLLIALVVCVILTVGTTFFEGRWTYLPLFGHLPASFGVRIPGRLMLWVTLLLAILAAGAVAEFVRRAENLAAQRMPPWPGPWLRLATLVPLLLVLVETWNATAHPVVPDQPEAMRTITGPMLVLPTAALADQTVMLWSTSRFQQVANGSGGFASQRQSEMRRSVASFPDPASIEYLRQRRVNVVLLLRTQVVGTPWERAGDVPVEALGIRREDLDDTSVVFYLS